MKILIIGGSSTVGTHMIKSLENTSIDWEFTYNKHKILFERGHQLDITNKERVINLINEINPDIVFHTAALANIDLCEINNELARSVNINGTNNVIQGCKKTGSKIVYVSTSFVFNGEHTHYYEGDIPSPTTYYGHTKWKGEQLVQKSQLKYLILRTDALYGWIENWNRENPVMRTLRTLKADKVLREITDWYNTPTFLPDFVNAAHKLLKQDEMGIFHLNGPEFINRYNWSIKVAEIFGLDKKMIQPIKSEVLNLPAKRVNINLNNHKLTRRTGFVMKDIKEGLQNMLKLQSASSMKYDYFF